MSYIVEEILPLDRELKDLIEAHGKVVDVVEEILPLDRELKGG